VPRPGDVVTLTISEASTFHLVADTADGGTLDIRRTTAGEAWDRAQAESCGVPSSPATTDAGPRVSLGLPTVRVSTIPIYDPTDSQR